MNTKKKPVPPEGRTGFDWWKEVFIYSTINLVILAASPFIRR